MEKWGYSLGDLRWML